MLLLFLLSSVCADLGTSLLNFAQGSSPLTAQPKPGGTIAAVNLTDYYCAANITAEIGSGLEVCAMYDGVPSCCSSDPQIQYPIELNGTLCSFQILDHLVTGQCNFTGSVLECICLSGSYVIAGTVPDYFCLPVVELCGDVSGPNGSIPVVLCSGAAPSWNCPTDTFDQSLGFSLDTCEGLTFQNDPLSPYAQTCRDYFALYDQYWTCLGECSPVTYFGLDYVPACSSLCESTVSDCQLLEYEAGCPADPIEVCSILAPFFIPPGAGQCWNGTETIANVPTSWPACLDITYTFAYNQLSYTDSPPSIVNTTYCPAYNGMLGCCTDSDFENWFEGEFGAPFEVVEDYVFMNYLCGYQIAEIVERSMCSFYGGYPSPCSCFNSSYVAQPNGNEVYCLLDEAFCNASPYAIDIPSVCPSGYQLACNWNASTWSYSCECVEVAFDFGWCTGFTFNVSAYPPELLFCVEIDPLLNMVDAVACADVCQPLTSPADYPVLPPPICLDYCVEDYAYCKLGFYQILAPSCSSSSSPFASCEYQSIEVGLVPGAECFNGTAIVNTAPIYPTCVDIEFLDERGYPLVYPPTQQNETFCPFYSGEPSCCSDGEVAAILQLPPTVDAAVLALATRAECALQVIPHAQSLTCSWDGNVAQCMCLSWEYVTGWTEGYLCLPLELLCSGSYDTLQCTDAGSSTVDCWFFNITANGIDLTMCEGLNFNVSSPSEVATECGAVYLGVEILEVCPIACTPITNITSFWDGTWYQDSVIPLCNSFCQAIVYPCADLIDHLSFCGVNASVFCYDVAPASIDCVGQIYQSFDPTVGTSFGGTIPGSADILSINIPANAISGGPTVIAIIAPLPLTNIPPITADYVAYFDVSFDQNVTWNGAVTFTFDFQTDFVAGWHQDIYILIDGEWVEAGTTCSPPSTPVVVGTTITVDICHFTPFAATQTKPSVFGDPHFVGLFGQRFLFDAPPYRVYSIISTPSLQLNAYVVESPSFSIIGEIGVVVGNDAVFVTRDARVRINNVKAEAGTTLLSDAVSSLSRDAQKDDSGIILETPDLLIQMVPRGYEIDLKQIKLKTENGKEGMKMHGVLGQTWNAAKWPASSFTTEIKDQDVLFSGLLDGNGAEDYEVHDGLFGTDTKFGLFDTAAFVNNHVVPPVSASLQK